MNERIQELEQKLAEVTKERDEILSNSALLAVHLLRNWPKDKHDKFAWHLIGEQSLAEHDAKVREECKKEWLKECEIQCKIKATEYGMQSKEDGDYQFAKSVAAFSCAETIRNLNPEGE